MRTGRLKAALDLTHEERQQLELLLHRSRTASFLPRHARIVLACADADDDHVVAHRLRLSPTTV